MGLGEASRSILAATALAHLAERTGSVVFTLTAITGASVEGWVTVRLEASSAWLTCRVGATSSTNAAELPTWTHTPAIGSETGAVGSVGRAASSAEAV